MNKGKLSLSVLALFAICQTFGFGGLVYAAGAGSVVINEVAWAGSSDSGNNEWIELYNSTGSSVDLSGWYISDDAGASPYALSGAIPANGYYLIEDSEVSVPSVIADAIINLSLANSGDSLVLFDSTGAIIDSVNSSGGAWFAGSGTTWATMQRMDVSVSGDLAGNWGSGIGTPKALNVASVLPATKADVLMSVSSSTPIVGDVVTLNVNVSGAKDLFSYGSEIVYDPAVLVLESVNRGAFLGQSGAVSTSFQYGLKDSVEGKLLVAEARTQDTKSGVSGDGILFTVEFEVVGGEGSASSLTFGTDSFLSDLSADISTDFSGVNLTPQNATADPITGLQISEDSQRYAIKLAWVAPLTGADKYKVFRMNARGVWVLIGESAQVGFVDSDAVLSGGKIVPNVEYKYKVVAVKGRAESVESVISGLDKRGIKGDNNRSDFVDGRDLEKLARHFAQDDAQSGFDSLIDTTYDGLIDGSDLIDLGLAFAQGYK